METPQNPSAGKFDPPPGSQPVDPRSVKPSRGRLLSVAGFVLALLWNSHLLFRIPFFYRTSSYVTLGILVFGLLAYIASRQEADAQTRGDPYTPPSNVTR